MEKFPRPIETGNLGDGSPLTLGDQNQLGDLFGYWSGSGYLLVTAMDLNDDGRNELVASSSAIFSFEITGALEDGTPIVDRGLRWGETSRTPYRNNKPEDDIGLCGSILAKGDFTGDGYNDLLVAPQSIGTGPIMALSTGKDLPTHRADGKLVHFKWNGFEPLNLPSDPQWKLAPIDWNGDGKTDLVAIFKNENQHRLNNSESMKVPEDIRDRYTSDGQWKGEIDSWSLHLFRNTGNLNRYEFTYEGPIELSYEKGPFQDAAGTLCAVDPHDPLKGILLIGYYGDLWHLPLIKSGSKPKWGLVKELLSLHGSPFTRNAAFTAIDTGDICNQGRFDLIASDPSSNVYWCKYWGDDSGGRPIYDDPRKIKQYDPHVNGGEFSVPTTGDLSGTGMADLVVGGIEGYVLWYRTLSTNPLKFALPERLRVGNEEIRRYGKPNPSAGYHWGSSQSPSDGFNGGYSNPLLVDWDGDGLLDLIIGDMIGLYDWYPNRGSSHSPKFHPPMRLHCGNETLLGPWRVRPGAADFTGNGLPDLVTMDKDLDLSIFYRIGRDDLTGLHPGEKLHYEDGEVIKTHGVYTPWGGDGRGRTKIEIVDWNKDGRWDLILGVGPQYKSAFLASYLLLCRNVGSNKNPIFSRPEILLFDKSGNPLTFWRHGVHPAVVDWDGDDKWEILVGADKGMIWYYKQDHLGATNCSDLPNPARPSNDSGSIYQ